MFFYYVGGFHANNLETAPPKKENSIIDLYEDKNVETKSNN